MSSTSFPQLRLWRTEDQQRQTKIGIDFGSIMRRSVRQCVPMDVRRSNAYPVEQANSFVDILADIIVDFYTGRKGRISPDAIMIA